MGSCGLSCAEYCIHLVGVNRLSACREFWCAELARCRDGVNVLWCRVWLVLGGSIPACTCFHSENFLVTCLFVCLFFLCIII